MTLFITSPQVSAVLFVCVAHVLWRIYRLLARVYGSPLRILPGPPAPSWIYGHMKQIVSEENAVLPDKWFEQYGKHFLDRDFFMTPRLWTLDPRAIQYVLAHPYEYPRPEGKRKMHLKILGRGLLFVQGEEHRLQRRILNPAFGPAQIRDLTEIFVRKSIELRDIWITATKDGIARVNVTKDLSRMTLDVIGLAGFGYDFHALDPLEKHNELGVAFRQLFSNAPPVSSILPLLRDLFPVLKLIPSKRMAVALRAAAILRRVSKNIVGDRKAEVMREASGKHLNGVERKDLQGRDLLTLLIKANMARDIPESQKLSDDAVVGQIPTFLLAGHETTSTATTWALYALSQKPDIQQKLRDELLAVSVDTPTMDELMELPYLDNVVRETLRLHCPIIMLVREAQHDDVLPVSEPFTDRLGNTHNEIRIAKGEKVVIPILAFHRSKDIWGEGALEFKPERWDNPPEAISAIPGVWGHLLTFLGGPRACIGYRFSLVEIKALLFTLVRAFEFELGVPSADIFIRTGPVQRPSVRSAPEQGFQLPLLLKPCKIA
ncbi:cytochrome P450 [Trametes maxima]|nr:cytochrome P450 [Trametes maxima]